MVQETALANIPQQAMKLELDDPQRERKKSRKPSLSSKAMIDYQVIGSW